MKPRDVYDSEPRPISHDVRWFITIAALALLVAGSVAAEATPPAPELPTMLDIDWRLGPDLPQGFQDSEVAILHDTLVSVGGFCSGEQGVTGKPDQYPRGFLSKTWGLDLDRSSSDWRELPDLPGAARQGMFGAVVDDRLYVWGGFSYEAPHCYRDGYRLSRDDGRWRWERLPDLPWPIAGAGVAHHGSKIYVLGGAQYDLERFFTAADRHGDNERLGARLLVFDTDEPDAGWRELASCPGTPRWVHALTAVDGQLYAIGGATGSDNTQGSYYTVVDNWKFDIDSGRWDRLPDLPISSGNFPDNEIVFDERYILLIGGYPYSKVQGPDGSLREPYGKPYKHYPDVFTYSDIFVYDTATDTFGKATPMPLNNNLPSSIIAGNRLYMIGGEIERAEIDGVHYGHHPDLCLIGEIHATDP